MTDHLKTIINGRFIYFVSLLSDDDNSDRKLESKKFDDYLGTLHEYHIRNKLKFMAYDAQNMNTINKKRLKDKEKLMIIKNCILSVCEKKELEHFVLSLDDKDEWEELKLKYILKYENLLSDLGERSGEPSDERTLKCKIEKKINKKKAEADMLEELEKCLLLSVDNIDYLQEEEPRDIIFKEKL